MGDVNGDGRPDIVVAVNGTLDQDVAVLLQNADGSFAAPTYLATGTVWGATAIAIGDINGDGRADIVATTGGNSPTFFAAFYQGAGGVLGPSTHVATYDSPAAVSVADLNGDGRLDVVVSHFGWGSVSVYLQSSSGVLEAEQRFSAPYGSPLPGQMAVGDFNADGRADIVIAGVLLAQLPQTQASGSGLGAIAGPSRSIHGLLASPGATARALGRRGSPAPSAPR